MLRSSHKSYLFLLLTICSPLAATKPSTVKKMMAKHKTILQQKKILSLNKLPVRKRHKLLVTAYNINEKQMLGIYLNDWAIKQCAQSNHITDVQGRNVTVEDIEKHLKKARSLKLSAPLYRAIGQRIADFYLISHIQKHVRKFSKDIKSELKNKINQSMAIVLMYAYDAQRNKQQTLEFPQQSIPARILGKLKPDTQRVLGKIFNFAIV